MHLKIEGPAVTKVEHTLLAAALKRMRRVSRQADIGRRIHLLARSVGRDVGERTLQPDIQFIARMTVVGDNVSGGRPQQNLPSTFSEIATQGRYFDALWQAFQLQWRPVQLANVDDGLVRTEGISTFGWRLPL